MATLTSDLAAQARQAANHCSVPSFTTNGKHYLVKDAFSPWVTCSCEDFRFRRQRALGVDRLCKHIDWARHAIGDIYELAVLLRLRTEDPIAALETALA